MGTETGEVLSAAPLLSVVVPTRDEAGNVKPFLERLLPHLEGRRAEVVFVDDSDDGTPEAVRAAAGHASVPVRLVHRPKEARNGLAGAVVDGIRATAGRWVCVLDADLQHPPELVPTLLAEAESRGSDVVVASRYADGRRATSFGAVRSLLSRGSTLAAKTLFPRRLDTTSDPMSGFFLIRRSLVPLDRLRPRGFKILLEILARSNGLRVSEVPFEFGVRHAEKSKASAREAAAYVLQLWELRVGAVGRRLAAFGIVGLSGLAINALAFAAFLHLASLQYLAAAALATQVSTLWNFVWLEWLVFDRKRKRRRSRGTRLLGFAALNNAGLVLRGPLLVVLVNVGALGADSANIVSLVALTAARFVIADGWIWGGDEEQTAHAYDVHGLVSVASDVALPELEPFRVPGLDEPATVTVQVGALSRLQTDLVTTLLEPIRPVHTRYDEGLGRIGFGVDLMSTGSRVHVVASPLLRRSPHVLYTNVVEPVIRWSLVARGYALVHGACIADGGRAHLITAHTDTGKTTTILKLLERHPASFLSDDLTLVRSDGRVLAYPKPLTISRHTVKAVRRPLLSLRERLGLFLQSRVHSRSGRQFAFLLTRTKLPIATINALVQLIVPPPKYAIGRLIPHVLEATTGQLETMVVIRRGDGESGALQPEEATEILMANSGDAFGFPPYAAIEPFLRGHTGQDLADAEREIVASALAGCRAAVLHSASLNWYEQIPELVGLNGAAGAALGEPVPVKEVSLAFE
ncbi:MAG TPA: glycosyltransferase family 2 protein [Gaiellaceae bacterium]|nr:glycosyltransferase family 2 protein [Gaiellaceae bacterium]